MLIILFTVSTATLIAIHSIQETKEVSMLHSLSLLLVMIGTLLLLSTKYRKNLVVPNAKLLSGIGSTFLIASLVLTPIPIIVRVLGLNINSCGGTQYSANLALSRFTPYSLLELMEKDHRLATEIHTHKGHDLRAAQNGILGSDARGIVIDKKFGQYPEAKKLVTIDQVPYGYFFSRPWQTNELSRLGIRYLLVNQSPDKELDNKNWKRIGQAENLSLYENPTKPTPVYLLKTSESEPYFVRKYKFSGNHIYITLPEISSPTILIITILNKAGFVANIDGKESEIISQKNRFIGIKIQPGDKKVELWHHPYSWHNVIFGIGFALLISILYGNLLTSHFIKINFLMLNASIVIMSLSGIGNWQYYLLMSILYLLLANSYFGEIKRYVNYKKDVE